MKLAVFYDHVLRAAEQRSLPLPEVLRRVRKMGYTLLEVDFDHLEADPALADKLRAAGFGIANICCYFSFEKEADRGRMQRLIAAAKQAGAPRVMPIPGLYTEKSNPAELARMTSAMAQLTSMAQATGLTITLEDYDHPLSPIYDSKGLLHFLRDQEALGVAFDTGNFRFANEDVLSAFHALKERIRHVHVKDRALAPCCGESNRTALDGTPLYPCAVGAGVLPLRDVFALLKGIGYDQVLTVEHFDADDQLQAMADSARFMHRHFTFE